MAKHKLKMGMVGGGIGAFIGPVHRMAATLDNHAELVAGCFSSNPQKSKKAGEAYMLDPVRVYNSYEEMIEKELALPDSERIDFVSIVVPNVHHFAIAMAFLKAGFNVVCDKPMTISLAEAKKLRAQVEKSGKVFVLTHNYTGYPMVKEAKNFVASGKLGKINKIVVEYPQGWMAGLIESRSNAIGMWRMDPEIAGSSNCMGDLGTHAYNLVRYITGLDIVEMCADITSFIPDSELDDDGNLLVRYDNGARGIIYASQISAGEENPLKICVYGTRYGIEWRQEEPNYLWLKDPAGTMTRYSRGNSNLSEAAKSNSRLPWGHPEGFIEAFANVYNEAFKAISAERSGKRIPEIDAPSVEDGVDGLRFLETIIASSKSKSKWTKMKA
jgi:predicted dehydrogenase